MVSITIIITSVSSALALVQSSITATRVGGSQILASNLAREGIEVARSVRDSNWMAGTAFSAGLTDAASKTARPILDPATGAWRMVFGGLSPGDEETRLHLVPEGLYLHADAPPDGSAPSLYRRLMTINHLCRDDAAGNERLETAPAASCNIGETLAGLAVRSEVSYPSVSGAVRSVVVEGRLYDWR